MTNVLACIIPDEHLTSSPFYFDVRPAELPLIHELSRMARMNAQDEDQVKKKAAQLITQVRSVRWKEWGIDAFLQQYHLSSQEGIVLMCLAESLCRVPDDTTVDLLIKDKMSSLSWRQHVGESSSLFVNAATWGLVLTGKIVEEKDPAQLDHVLKRLFVSGGTPLVRAALKQAIKIMGQQFVFGSTIQKALKRAKKFKHYRHSYDMLGEAAKTREDARRYFESYMDAIESIGQCAKKDIPIEENPGISIKISALHPVYLFSKRHQLWTELFPLLKTLALRCQALNIGLTIDAEETYRLAISLELFERLMEDSDLHGWGGLGLAVQAYQKRAHQVIDWLASISQKYRRRIMIRLVKGAYWDSEIKWCQMEGLSDYPVFTKKVHTDISYLACAKKILQYQDCFYPQFATHNAHTVAVILHWFKGRSFEFQCLHGMGYPLYDPLMQEEKVHCRVYAPCGPHTDLLAYLVRRLLENGANTSFVHRIVQKDIPMISLIEHPVDVAERVRGYQSLALPPDLYGPSRKNSQGLDIHCAESMRDCTQAISAFLGQPYQAIQDWSAWEQHVSPSLKRIYSPIDTRKEIGSIAWVQADQVKGSIESAHQSTWSQFALEDRVRVLRTMADQLEQHRNACMALLCAEAGKTLVDAMNEVREAVDFCRYYAALASQVLVPQVMPGPTGELNQLYLQGRGVWVCISPWNFPLAIFLGQIAAALVAGNTVVAKPSVQTALIAHYAVDLFKQSGLPSDALYLVPGSSREIGDALLLHPLVEGVMLTGSTDTAKQIHRSLASRPGPIVPLIAETGGQNAMIVDSTALPEQVVQDVLVSAFGSAGQRCSALRVLYLQEEIADKVIHMLTGAMQELEVGSPLHLSTDIGPVIDAQARLHLLSHIERMHKEARFIAASSLSDELKNQGHFVAPHAFEIDSIHVLKEEIFGPVLHIIRYSSNQLPKVLDDIHSTGYGLTLGIHSRIQSTIQFITERAKVGNIYVNRSMTGAVVGVQPFGGERLSGTGPKAGGPHYLYRLCTERVVSINTTASGGNAELAARMTD